jgi:hypothetical protein
VRKDCSNSKANVSRFNWFGATSGGLTSSHKGCRSSEIAAYLLILGSLLSLCSIAVQPVSSQTFDASTSTQTNTATYYILTYTTSNLSVTVLTVQYTTSTSMFTLVSVQFTTLTSFITHIEIAPQSVAQAPPLNSPGLKNSSPSRSQPNTTQQGLQVTRFAANELSAMLELFTCGAIVFVIVMVLRRKKIG